MPASDDQYAPTPTPRADAARPVPADVLEKCARLLGDEWGCYEDTDNSVRIGKPSRGVYPSDGDLLLAILNKAAELGMLPLLGHTKDGWSCSFYGSADRWAGFSSAPLDAALLAFAQLEPPHDR